MMLISSMSHNLKVLHGELNNAIVRNNELEGRLDEVGWEMADMKAEVAALKAETRERTVGQDGSNTVHKQNNILSVSQMIITSQCLALTTNGACMIR